VAFYTVKIKKLWLIKALNRGSRRTIARVLGGRDSATFKRLYDKVTYLKNCLFYTDNWNAFADVLPPERHIIGKSETHAIERDNSNTCHHLGRFTRRTKVVSKSSVMVDLSIRLWCALTKPEIFKLWQSQMMYILR
jgi:insertion element IS1 protein InsB